MYQILDLHLSKDVQHSLRREVADSGQSIALRQASAVCFKKALRNMIQVFLVRCDYLYVESGEELFEICELL